MPLDQTVPAVPDMAIYSFSPIEVSPLPVTAGQSITISMTVENTGTAAGTFKAGLVINNSNIDSTSVSLGPKTSGQIQFQTTLTAAGKYDIRIGPQTKTIDVTEQRVQSTIKISGDAVDGFNPLVGSTSDPTQMQATNEGHLIKLSAPDGDFVVNSIRIMGYIKDSTYDFNHDPVYGPGVWVYGPDIAAAEPLKTYFSVTIWDNKHNRLYSGNFNKDLFTYNPGWVMVNVPSVSVSGDFLVEVNTYNQPRLNAMGWGDWDPWHRYVVHTWYNQLCIGYQDSMNVQSWVSENGSIIPDYNFTYNWLVQANGYSK